MPTHKPNNEGKNRKTKLFAEVEKSANIPKTWLTKARIQTTLRI